MNDLAMHQDTTRTRRSGAQYAAGPDARSALPPRARTPRARERRASSVATSRRGGHDRWSRNLAGALASELGAVPANAGRGLAARLLVAALALGAQLATGCSGPPAPMTSTVTIRALTPDNEPVEGTQLWAAGRDLGMTDAEGQLRATFQTSTTLTATCPATHQTMTPERRLNIGAAQGREQSQLEVTLRCKRLQQRVALVVRTHGADGGLPLRVRGEVVGHTDSDGVAHVLLEARAGSTLRVSLETSAHAALRPQDPVQTFRLGDGDEILLFDQRFERARPPRRKARAPRSQQTAARPYRIL